MEKQVYTEQEVAEHNKVLKKNIFMYFELLCRKEIAG